MILDVQFNSATTPWPEMRDAVRAAEDQGYGVAWVVDHLAGQMMSGGSMMECFTLVGALAASTTTIGIGTLVANVWNRPLAVLAIAAATAQEVAQGRFWLGLGSGGSPLSPFGAEHNAVGIELSTDLATRHRRITDFLALARPMWATGQVGGVIGFPQVTQPIPILLGVNSVALAEIAAVAVDGINIRSNHPRLEEIIAAARAARPAHLPPLSITTWVTTSDAIRDPDSPERHAFEAMGVDRLIVVQFERADPALLGRPV